MVTLSHYLWLSTSYLAKTKMFQQKNQQQVVCNM